MYSSQPEESTRTSSEAVISIPVVILPLHSLGDAAKIFDGSRFTKTNASIEYVNDELLAGLELKLFATFASQFAVHDIVTTVRLYLLTT